MKANSQANEGSGQIIYAEVTDIDAEKKAETMLTLTEKTLFSVIEESGVQFWEPATTKDGAGHGLGLCSIEKTAEHLGGNRF